MTSTFFFIISNIAFLVLCIGLWMQKKHHKDRAESWKNEAQNGWKQIESLRPRNKNLQHRIELLELKCKSDNEQHLHNFLELIKASELIGKMKSEAFKNEKELAFLKQSKGEMWLENHHLRIALRYGISQQGIKLQNGSGILHIKGNNEKRYETTPGGCLQNSSKLF